MKTRLPLKSGGAFIQDSNFETVLFTESQAKTFIKKQIAHKNRKLKKLGYSYRHKFLGLKDCGKYWTYSAS